MTGNFQIVWNADVFKASGKFRVAITKEATEGKRSSLGPATESRKMRFWSFAAHVALMDFFSENEQCQSLLITSGTLKPLEALALQLGGGTVE